MNNDWIHGDIPEEDILKNDDGSSFMPIEKVYPLLDKYDPTWGHTDFKFHQFEFAGKFFASGSVVLLFPEQKRKLVGAATVEILPDENQDYNLNGLEAVLLSETTKNGAKKIGKRFGRYLNKKEPNSYFDSKKKQKVRRDELSPAKFKPDQNILDEYEEAFKAGNKQRMEEIEKTYQI